MKPTRTRGAVVVGAVVVGALAVGTGLAGCSAFQSCEEQDRRTRAGLEQAWPDEFGTGHRGSGSGACDDDPLYLSAGVGMTADEVQHVFDRFWRADPARARTTGGTGLGLAISLEDAHLHGGWLEAWGRPGRGASFRLTLPRRAGIRLQSSPLPLVSEAVVGRGLPAEWSAEAPVVEDVEGTAGPADLPSVTGGIPVVLPREHDPHPGRGAEPGPGADQEPVSTDVQEAR